MTNRSGACHGSETAPPWLILASSNARASPDLHHPPTLFTAVEQYAYEAYGAASMSFEKPSNHGCL
jgi:hypothetical protein